MDEDIIDNTNDRFMINISEIGRRTIDDSDDDYVDEKNPLFGNIDGATRCGIDLHVTPTKKRRKNRD